MRETEGHGGADTHTQQKGRDGGGDSLDVIGHFGDIPCREVSLNLTHSKH